MLLSVASVLRGGVIPLLPDGCRCLLAAFLRDLQETCSELVPRWVLLLGALDVDELHTDKIPPGAHPHSDDRTRIRQAVCLTTHPHGRAILTCHALVPCPPRGQLHHLTTPTRYSNREARSPSVHTRRIVTLRLAPAPHNPDPKPISSFSASTKPTTD